MADIYMHQKMAKEFIDAHPSFYETDAMRHATFLGSQGPDPFYYRVLSKPSKRKRSMDTGNLFHDAKTAKTLRHLVERLKGDYTKERHAFFNGFVLHYLLDIHIHPYVYHHVGVYDRNDPSTYDQRGLHLKFERRMDKCLIEKDTNAPAHRYPLSEKALPYKHVPAFIATIIDDIGKHVYGIQHAGKDYAQGYRGMRFTLWHIIRDPKGKKKRFYGFLDRFTRRRDLFFEDLSFYYPKRLRYDYLNEANRIWNHPVTSEPSSESVEALYAKAMGQADHVFEAVQSYLKGTDSIDDALFDNRSYNKGVDCEDPRPMKDFDLFTKSID